GGKSGEPELLAEAYRNSLALAVLKGIKSIAFPSISTGAYGYPIQEACKVALKTVKEFLEKEDKLEKVALVLYSKHDFEVYKKAVKEILQ
ncbi:MAG: macro domain-containing protein, partial [Candidatus Bathyarchaeia archaeon]